MASKNKTLFVCQNCGSERPKWEGQCHDCGAWNSLVEEKVMAAPKNERAAWSVGAPSSAAPSAQIVLKLDSEVEVKASSRWDTGMHELNRVLGGGLVAGSYTLLGGDPGIGKSTLLMQMAGRLGDVGRSVLYVSGEESVEQTALRAQRLGVKSAAVQVASESRLNQILALVEKIKPQVLIVDSIQTIYLDEIASAPGTVSQVRECAARLMAVAKNLNVAVFLVGHVTKDGHIAGPKTLEHIVDTVLSFEGDANYQFRLLRAQKNRFGPTNELGVFQMSGSGLEEVANPSELFLAERGESLVGSTVFSAVEGTRPMLCEVQSLCSSTFMAMPRRTSLGFDVNRVHLLAAVLDKHHDCDFATHDVFVNVVGGLKITEPAADLAIAAVMLSSISNQTLPPNTIFFGEVGLTGEVRASTMAVERLKEAEKLGFNEAILPVGNKKHIDKNFRSTKIRLRYLKHVGELSKFLIYVAGETTIKNTSAKNAPPKAAPTNDFDRF